MIRFNPEKHHRRSIRLRGYDYSQEGLYFVTICTQNRECLFGEILGGEMILNECGEIAYNGWLDIPQHYQNVILHQFVIMPNHIHGILEIVANEHEMGNVGVEYIRPLRRRPNCESGTIGAIIRGFKIGITKQLGYSPWQRNYHEHIIRNPNDYARIDDYMANILHNGKMMDFMKKFHIKISPFQIFSVSLQQQFHTQMQHAAFKQNYIYNLTTFRTDILSCFDLPTAGGTDKLPYIKVAPWGATLLQAYARVAPQGATIKLPYLNLPPRGATFMQRYMRLAPQVDAFKNQLFNH